MSFFVTYVFRRGKMKPCFQACAPNQKVKSWPYTCSAFTGSDRTEDRTSLKKKSDTLFVQAVRAVLKSILSHAHNLIYPGSGQVGHVGSQKEKCICKKSGK